MTTICLPNDIEDKKKKELAKAVKKLDCFYDMAIDKHIVDYYDKVIVCFSGGKDSMACLLYLLLMGVPKEKIELWHHVIDGMEGSELMDWPCTEDYCRKVAEYFGIDYHLSWKTDGFEGEMLRNDEPTKSKKYMTPDGNIVECPLGKETKSTRMKFPQVSGDLSVRWCSAYLKIDVCVAAIVHQARYNGQKVLVVSGERAEESSNRAKYRRMERDRSDARKSGKRHADRWRPAIYWKEQTVWELYRIFGINPHPAYWLGWGRLSCFTCIFGSYNQWASAHQIAPERTEKIMEYETLFDCTIRHKESVKEQITKGVPYPECLNEELVKQALSKSYYMPATVEKWSDPPGAYGENAGPS